MDDSADAASFEDLPDPVLLNILCFLPLVERVRCALVALRWKHMLAVPAFWAELRIDGAGGDALRSSDTLLQLCRRARGQLRSLDASHPACGAMLTDAFFHEGGPFAAERLGRSLVTLSASSSQILLRSAAGAAALRAACPALSVVSLGVSGCPEDIAAALRILPAKGAKHLLVVEPPPALDSSSSVSAPLRWSALADWVPSALSASSIAGITFTPGVLGTGPRARAASDGSGGAGGSGSGSGDADADAHAAWRLAEALASPGTGVRRLCFQAAMGSEASPLLASLCRALITTAEESPLTALDLAGSGVDGVGAAQLAAVIAPHGPGRGRCGLRSLSLSRNDLARGDDDGSGELALLAALVSNDTLTELRLWHVDPRTRTGGGRGAPEALSAALRSNATLRRLHVEGSFFTTTLEQVAFGALGESPGKAGNVGNAGNSNMGPNSDPNSDPISGPNGSSRCVIAHLEVVFHSRLDGAACAAIGAALARGPPSLETLEIRSDSEPRGASHEEILVGIAAGEARAGGAASRLRRFSLAYNVTRFGGPGMPPLPIIDDFAGLMMG